MSGQPVSQSTTLLQTRNPNNEKMDWHDIFRDIDLPKINLTDLSDTLTFPLDFDFINLIIQYVTSATRGLSVKKNNKQKDRCCL